MGLSLRRELLAYGTSLLVLQGLEAKHHLISIKISRGRAVSCAAVSAELRRLQNQDIQSAEFQESLPRLLERLGELTSLPYNNKTQLLQKITGQIYRGLHDNLFLQQEYFSRYREYLKKSLESRSKHIRSPDYDLYFHHARELLCEGAYYALPQVSSGNGGFADFQMLAMSPGRRMYAQRAAAMSIDVSLIRS